MGGKADARTFLTVQLNSDLIAKYEAMQIPAPLQRGDADPT